MGIKKFDRSSPCTKIDIWNCFATEGGFAWVPVGMAPHYIGNNAHRNMLDKGYLTIEEDDEEEYFVLTDEGEEWLIQGTYQYIKNHPNKRKSFSKPGACLFQSIYIERGWGI